MRRRYVDVGATGNFTVASDGSTRVPLAYQPWEARMPHVPYTKLQAFERHSLEYDNVTHHSAGEGMPSKKIGDEAPRPMLWVAAENETFEPKGGGGSPFGRR